MTTSMQPIDLEPATARPAGLRATAIRRLRRDKVALFAFVLLGLLIIAALIGGPLAAHLTGHSPIQQFPNALASDGEPIGIMQRKTLFFSSLMGPGSSDVGGSMAMNARIWKRWVTTMSRNAPVCS